VVVIFLAQKIGIFFFSVNSTTFVNILENLGGQKNKKKKKTKKTWLLVLGFFK
jgi:hypothetical protein